jgi:hypothetical protein
MPIEPLVVLSDDTTAELLLRDAAATAAINFREMRPTADSIPSTESQTNPLIPYCIARFRASMVGAPTIPTVDLQRVPVARRF